MGKERTAFSCTTCAYKTIKWLGCCPSCNAWDSFKEELFIKEHPQKKTYSAISSSVQPLSSVIETEKIRQKSGIQEWDRVLGGGLVKGSLIILTGDPGIGKSTLLLHVCNALSKNGPLLYVSTE